MARRHSVIHRVVVIGLGIDFNLFVSTLIWNRIEGFDGCFFISTNRTSLHSHEKKTLLLSAGFKLSTNRM
jgi:hypothetical protein